MTTSAQRDLRLLIVDDEADLRWVLRGLFRDAGFTVTEAGSGEEALRQMGEAAPDVILSDVRMPGMHGIDLLRAIQQRAPNLPVVLLSAVEDVATAVEAMRHGAFDYQPKPFDQERLLLTVQRAAEQRRMREELVQLRAAVAGERPHFGDSPKAQELEHLVGLVAAQPTMAVLLVGESGTGKEVVAREIHRRSPRSQGPFVPVDCGALPEQLMESQLFGHTKGAFTGADRDRPGMFRTADGGTLFLDELGNLPVGLQAKLLRALQERVVVPVGGGKPVPFDARLVCATNTRLEQAIEAGGFRMDLYHRVAEFVVELPPLRERRDDIGYFAHRFLSAADQELGRKVSGFSQDAIASLEAREWPGNLRELRNAVRRAALLCSGEEISANDLQQGGGLGGHGVAAGDTSPRDSLAADPLDWAGPGEAPLAERVRHAADAVEARLLQDALAESDGNKAAAARQLGIDYTTLHRKLKKHGLTQG